MIKLEKGLAQESGEQDKCNVKIGGFVIDEEASNVVAKKGLKQEIPSIFMNRCT